MRKMMFLALMVALAALMLAAAPAIAQDNKKSDNGPAPAATQSTQSTGPVAPTREADAPGGSTTQTPTAAQGIQNAGTFTPTQNPKNDPAATTPQGAQNAGTLVPAQDLKNNADKVAPNAVQGPGSHDTTSPQDPIKDAPSTPPTAVQDPQNTGGVVAPTAQVPKKSGDQEASSSSAVQDAGGTTPAPLQGDPNKRDDSKAAPATTQNDAAQATTQDPGSVKPSASTRDPKKNDNTCGRECRENDFFFPAFASFPFRCLGVCGGCAGVCEGFGFPFFFDRDDFCDRFDCNRNHLCDDFRCDRNHFCDRFDCTRNNFFFCDGGGVCQVIGQEAESGNVNLSLNVSQTGNNSNQSVAPLQFGNTGSLQNAQGVLQVGGPFNNNGFCRDRDHDGDCDNFERDGFLNGPFFGFGNGIELEGSSFVFSPTLTSNSSQLVQQSATA